MTRDETGHGRSPATPVVALAAILSLGGCARDQSSLTDNPLHFATVLERAAIAEGSDPSPNLAEPIEWRFEDPQTAWTAAVPWNPTIGVATVARASGSLRVTLTEATRGYVSPDNPRPEFAPDAGGGISVELPGWKPDDWEHIEVRARTRDAITVSLGFNQREVRQSNIIAPFPFQVSGGIARTTGDGDVHTYRVPVNWPPSAHGDWRRLGVWFTARGTASIDILSIRAVPKEAAFAGAAVGTHTVGNPEVPALYVRAPGRIQYNVRVPDRGRLEVGLRVLRGDASVTFRITATPQGAESDTLLAESRADPTKPANRSVDLSHLAGRTVTLTFQAESERAGTVALWVAPTLYTPTRLAVSVLDDLTGTPTPSRVRLTMANGATAPLPDEAIGIMWGSNDRPVGYGFQPDSAFYVDGSFDVELEPGRYQLKLSKGTEYLEQRHELEVEPGAPLSRTFRLARWVNMATQGWYSADGHIHQRRSPRENPLILKWVAAEDVNVGALLQMGDAWSYYHVQYAFGRDGVYRLEEHKDHMLTSGQEEPRTHELGHTISLAADDFVRFAGEYYHYDRVFDRVHELGGVTGYAHQGVTFHGYRGLTLDVLRNKVDFIEILQFCVSREPLHLDHYYHFLDLGFKLTAMAGSDFPYCRTGPGSTSRIGEARFYTYLGNDFSFENWRASLHAGHTFVSSGPIIDLNVNGKIPGDELDVAPGSPLTISATALGHRAQVSLEKLEIVAHGKVVRTVAAREPGQTADRLAIAMELPAERGVWIAARAWAGVQQAAHTTPVYITVGGSGFHNPDKALEYLALNERYLADLEKEIAQPSPYMTRNAWRYREGLEARIAETREVIAKLRARFAGDRP